MNSPHEKQKGVGKLYGYTKSDKTADSLFRILCNLLPRPTSNRTYASALVSRNGLVEALVVGFLNNGSQYRDAVAFVILIVILLVKPSGLLGKHVVEKV